MTSEKLTPRQRQIHRLLFVEKAAPDDIARDLGMTRIAVAAAAHMVRRKLGISGAGVSRAGKVVHVAPHAARFGFSLAVAICGAKADARNSVVLSRKLSTCAACNAMVSGKRKVALAKSASFLASVGIAQQRHEGATVSGASP